MADEDGIIINSGTVIGKIKIFAMTSAPNLDNYTNPSLSVSTNIDGTSPTTYDHINIDTYKYFKVAPGVQHTIT